MHSSNLSLKKHPEKKELSKVHSFFLEEESKYEES